MLWVVIAIQQELSVAVAGEAENLTLSALQRWRELVSVSKIGELVCHQCCSQLEVEGGLWAEERSPLTHPVLGPV